MNEKSTERKWKPLKQVARDLLLESNRTNHNRIVSCGLLVALCLLSARIGWLLLRSFHGTSSAILLAAFCLGVYEFGKRYRYVSKLQAPEEDLEIGYGLILIGVLVSPFCLFSEWSITIVGLLILLGVAVSTWGILFIKNCFSPTVLLLFGLFPHPVTVANAVWSFLVPDQTLERFMAWSGGMGLRVIGQPTEVTDIVIKLPDGAVSVLGACSGYTMALTVAGAGLLVGIFFNQSFGKIILLVFTGVVLALVLNIPRIMLMAMANAYWGEAQFKFWHDGWGSQIFSGVLFTAYYYSMMAIIRQKTSSQSRLR